MRTVLAFACFGNGVLAVVYGVLSYGGYVENVALYTARCAVCLCAVQICKDWYKELDT